MIDVPAIFLCFDDYYVKEWYKTLDFLDDNNIKATFYPCYIDKLSEEEWDMLKEIQSRGHTIGHHGIHHWRTRAAVARLGCRGYLKEEINRGLQLFKERRIKARHFAYPCGDRDEKTDACLLGKFNTIRGVAIGETKYFYTSEELSKTKLVNARPLYAARMNLVIEQVGVKVWLKPSIGTNSLENLVAQGDCAIFIYTHVPSEQDLVSLSNIEGVNFYPMENFECSM